MPEDDLGPMPAPKIEPGEPNPGGPDALVEDPESLGAIPDLTPDENPAIDDQVPDDVKDEVSDSEDTSTKATRDEDEPEHESPA